MKRKRGCLRTPPRYFPLLLFLIYALIINLNQAQTSLELDTCIVNRDVMADLKTADAQRSSDTVSLFIENITYTPRFPQPNQRVIITAKVVDNSSSVKRVVLSYQEKVNYYWYGIHQYWGPYEWSWDPLTWNVYTGWINVTMAFIENDVYETELFELPYYSSVLFKVYAINNAGDSIVSDIQIYHVVGGNEYIIFTQVRQIIDRVVYIALGLILVRGLGKPKASEKVEHIKKPP